MHKLVATAVFSTTFFLACQPTAGTLQTNSSRQWQQVNPNSRALLTGNSQVTGAPAGSVHLNGDAFFTTRDTGLTIHTRSLTIQLHQAAARINSFNKENGATVEVLSGTATVQKNYRSAFDTLPETLHAGEMILFNREVDLMEKETTDTTALRENMENRLVLDQLTAAAAVKKINDWFSVNLVTTGDWTNTIKASNIFRNADLKTVLDWLALTYKASYRQQADGTILLTK
ncbi:DUF4974 domain-containing protein [Deminuibacter soli]|uniref:DUF4974 domain-containing protein n=1 Tax=Deminuibacter soli TaxID=2291815 RepID=A0A3E1NHM1_9BACT|nr:DUF4974 domain-containing protein [Deminuibacter soli]RFM27439.1 DUF4974 domain-containing protein [Deminuibacter soli]